MHIKKSAKTALSLSFSLALAVNATFIGASSFSSSAAETTDSLTPVTISAPSTQPLSTTTVNSANTTTTSTAPSNYTTTTTTAPIDPTKPQSGTTVSVPLSGTYSLKLNVADIVSHENITGLNCELFNLDTKEVIASWNTSDEPVKSFENLKYSFNSPTSLTGNIRYAIRITNLPDNYVFFYGKDREFYGISGFGLEEFAKGSDLTCTAFLENTDPDAPKVTYTTSPVNDSTTTTTTTTTTTAATSNTSTLPQTGYPLSTADVAAAACAMIGIGSVLTASSRKSKKHSD